MTRGGTKLTVLGRLLLVDRVEGLGWSAAEAVPPGFWRHRP